MTKPQPHNNKSRQIYNRMILEKLTEAVEHFPDYRFQQILQNLKIVIPGSDDWYQESVDTFKQMMVQMMV